MTPPRQDTVNCSSSCALFPRAASNDRRAGIALSFRLDLGLPTGVVDGGLPTFCPTLSVGNPLEVSQCK